MRSVKADRQVGVSRRRDRHSRFRQIQVAVGVWRALLNLVSAVGLNVQVSSAVSLIVLDDNHQI